MKSTNVVIIIPAYNEENTLARVVKGLRNAIAVNNNELLEFKILIVNDGSLDKTGSIAKQINVDYIVTHKTNSGLGAAVRSGLTAARQHGADIAIKFDADLQHDPQDIFKIIEPIVDDSADIVYGNRFSKISYKMPFIRNIGNKFFTAMMRWLTKWPLKDSQPGIFAVNKEYLNIFRLPGNYNYTQQVLLDAYHKNMRFSHVDVEFKKRIAGSSFVTLKYPFKVLPQLFWVIIGVAPMRIFVPFGLLFLLPSTAIFLWQITCFIFGYSPVPVQHVNFVMGAGLFGMQCIFFGVLAQLIIEKNNHR